MSAKLLHGLTDDNPDLQKQIGCMTGIFQIFDRHHNLTGRRINGHGHKRLPPGHSNFNSGNLGMEINNEKNLKNINENQRASTESSKASFSSSSCSSPFSSSDCNKAAQPEHPFFNQTILPETRSRYLPANETNASPQLGRQSLHLRDVVKDSIYREARGLSIKTTTKEEAVGCRVKHRDSPRPLQLSKSVDGSYKMGINGKPSVPVDLHESLKVLTNLREAPWNFNEAREPSRSSYEEDRSSLSVPKDAPRFSYDGRDIHCPFFESQDSLKSTTKLKELPRLSLDSREGSMRGYKSNSKSKSISRDLQRGIGNSNNRIPNLQQESGTQKRLPSVVAKLMGLEALPDSMSAIEGQMGLIKTYQGGDHNSFSRSSKTHDKSEQNQISGSSRSFQKNPVSPQLRNPEAMKPISSSRFPIKPAPWRQPDSGRGYQRPAFKNCEAPARVPNSSPSVYSEIEKRLKELEFEHTGKDLRVVKQILEAMQVKRLSETKKEDQALNLVSQRNYNGLNYTNLDLSPRLAKQRNPKNNRRTSATIKGASPPRTFESTIVIIKPAKLIEKSHIPASSPIPFDSLTGLRKLQSGDSADRRNGLVNQTAQDVTPKNNHRDTANRALSSMDKKINRRTLVSTQTSTRPQNFPRENTTSTGSVSPRLRHKKLELEKRSRPPIPSSDSSNPRRQSCRQPTESGSPGGKRRPKSPILHQSDDQLSEISSETRNLSHQGDAISVCSESSISLASQTDTEFTSADQTAESNDIFFQQGIKSLSRKVANYSGFSLKQEKPTPRLSADGLLAELATVAPEQPSPVSVLDGSFYRDDLPSPVKKISIVFKDDKSQNSDDNPGGGGWNPVDLNHITDSMRQNLSSEINHKKLESIDHLLQKLRQLNLNYNEATTDYIASLCKNTNRDHRYISEILLASGLLLRGLCSRLTTIQLHPSGHPINPDLFFVLEQTRASTTLPKDEHSCEKVARLKPYQEKLHRKLVFDTVNEILVRKLALVTPLPEPFRPDKLAGRNLSTQQLLKELCSGIEQLQANNSECSLDDEDVRDFHGEVSGIVLDVERLVFKDLVDEIVSGEVANMRAKSSRRCRQLFAK